ncbi:MAG: triose-phosphate isomerase [Bdellovibrionaceae bacterium]|nr:triose-phosphate isomerase [Pseudobdellovibrionaceae bacterium]NUM56988.1 triose-phosphate isomerase [Pseudobdellovibrionaceae bacterium]
MKKLIFAANWKLNKTPEETRSFFKNFEKSFVAIYSRIKATKAEVMFFPPASSWEATGDSIKAINDKLDSHLALSWGAQNIYVESQGAFTGENSSSVMSLLGGISGLVGHSERRTYFKETNDFLNQKILSLQKRSLLPIYCIGETLQDRESGATEKILSEQLAQGLKNVSSENLVIAYEPVWAIGTGKIASFAQVSETHAFLRKWLNEKGFTETPILYGGSVKADNASELISISDVNGFLVGGASLEPTTFATLIENSLSL